MRVSVEGVKGEELAQVVALEDESSGFRARICTVGGALMQVVVPGLDGELVDVVLGYDEAGRYRKGEGKANFGSVVGRCANRIALGRMKVHGVEYELPRNNNGKHHLHGGDGGFYSRTFRIEKMEATDSVAAVELSYLSKDLEEGYPGDLETRVRYTLSRNLELGIQFSAVALDKPTIVNLCNHTYWNLGGHQSGPITNHKLFINSNQFTPVDEDLIITGELRSSVGSPLDFFTDGPKCLGDTIGDHPLDHNFVVGNTGLKQFFPFKKKMPNYCEEVVQLNLAARLSCPTHQISMEVFTDQPGIQVYTGNFIDKALPIWKGKGGHVYDKHHAICLETQNWPDSINHQDKGFPSPILAPNEEYLHCVVHRFSVGN